MLEQPLFTGVKRPGVSFSESGGQVDPIDLNFLVAHPNATFLVQHKGLSMINAFIPPDALLLVDKCIAPENNSIILALVNGELTVRYLKVNDYKKKLVPANRNYPDVEITAEMHFAILGVVTQIISDPDRLKDVC